MNQFKKAVQSLKNRVPADVRSTIINAADLFLGGAAVGAGVMLGATVVIIALF